MSNKIKFMLLILIILVLFIFFRSMKSTAAIVQIAEIEKHNITVTMASGEKINIKVPSKIDTKEFNKTSYYLIVFNSNMIQKNRLKKIEESK